VPNKIVKEIIFINLFRDDCDGTLTCDFHTHKTKTNLKPLNFDDIKTRML